MADDSPAAALRPRRASSPGLLFAVRFFVCLLLWSVVFWAFSLHERLGPVQHAIATASAAAARGAGGHSVAQGQDIIVKGLIMTVNHECTGIFVIMLFSSFVLAYPASWRARVAGLGVGIPLFFAVNVFRLATLARIVEVYPSAFFYLHEYVWQGILTVIVLVGAIAWAEKFG
jgi:exosortase/archaeosortase family protein